MTSNPFFFKEANRFIPFIAVIGIGIGSANYLLNGDLNWIQWVIQSLSTSFVIGYSLVLIVLNKSWFLFYLKTKLKLYIFFTLVFFLIGVLATEIEHMIRSLIFQNIQFQLFTSGKMYLFNGIIALILGYSFFQNNLIKAKNEKPVHSEQSSPALKKSNSESATANPINKIPIKQGENIALIPIESVVYFEAYDNYSFIYSKTGKKQLCDYSLMFLESRLSENFARVHRKYIVNENYIKQIKPHLNGRYVIVFNDVKIGQITSSKGYLSTIKNLIKIR
ncbi:LytTR family DNA-binding domain-containing protein [Spongiivirga sp. MCCC 1A20706]|uniref:LytR/AlgR family response regulator transcription factor n=1 Tax=Spongiivirga sp. MCCC 1A20706 TaxID=3160963 RepID=UPI003977546D